MKKEKTINKKFILDACCGGRMMWFNKNHPNTVYIDKRFRAKELLKDGSHFEVKPDVEMDFRNMAFPNNKFKLVVWDPPHLKNLQESSVLAKKFGVLNAQTYQTDLKMGFDECYRVLDNYGILIFKWNDLQINHKELFEIFGMQPLFGNRSSKSSFTTWFCFMKIPENRFGGKKE